MTVGNGLFSRGKVGAIDSTDLVIRFNGCRSVGEGGVRTNIVAVCNTRRPAAAMIGQAEWRSNPVRSAAEISCVSDASKLAQLNPMLAVKAAAHVSALVLARAPNSILGQ